MKILLLAALMLFSFHIHAQKKIVLKPGLMCTYGLNYIKSKGTAETSFYSPQPGFTGTLAGRAEFFFNKNSFIDFTIKGSEAALSFKLDKKNIFKNIHQTAVDITQLNFAYNTYLGKEKRIFKTKFSTRLKTGIGLGVSINKNSAYYREYLYRKYYGVSAPNVTFWWLYTATPDVNTGFNALARLGWSFYNKEKDKEVFDIFIEYNKGLRNLTNVDLQYNINGTTYQTYLGSRGTNINITAGFPITIWRKK